MSQSDNESDISDADPAAILDTIGNIDDLDAELFGPKKTTVPVKKDVKTPKTQTEKKKVSFHADINVSNGDDKNLGRSRQKATRSKDDDLDFDMDDPLAGLLSDEDEDMPSRDKAQSKPVEKKDSGADDWLFDDDDADDLLDDGGGKAKAKSNIEGRNENKGRLSVESLLRRPSTDELLKPTSKMTLDDFASKAAKTSPDKLATSPYTAIPSPATGGKQLKFDDEFGFGSYQPSVTPSTDNRKGRSRRQQSDSNNFFDFLNEDDGLKSPQQERVSSPVVAKQTPVSRRKISPTRPSTADVASPASLEVSSDGNQRVRPRSSETAQVTAASTQQKPVIYDTPIPTRSTSQSEKSGVDDVFQSKSSTPAFSIQPSRPRRNADFAFVNEAPVVPPTPTTRSMAINENIQQHYTTERTISTGEEARNQSLESQLGHSKALLHNVELAYKADLELTKTTYDSRIELLKSSFNDLKSRVDRELDSVRESYSSRILVLRNAMQTQVQADTSKECEHQEEIKRLRNLHLQALDECRVDGEKEVERLRQAHGKEMEAIKNSTYHARNIESMMSRVEEATDRLQQLSSKYESAHRAMTQQSESISLSNKQLISVVQNQLGQQQRSTSDAQIQMQQTASRLEGLVSEMNRKMEEQHYGMQLSHSNLQSAHTALQEERKQFMQQISLEREHLRKAHREMINIQNEIRQESRDDTTKLIRASDDLSSIAIRYEEAKITEAEQANRRNREHEDMMNQINAEKLELARKKAQLESSNERLNSQKLDLNSKLTQFNEEKQILQQIQHELEQREAETNAMSQKAIDSEADKERVYAEAKRIQEEQSKKLAEIHNDMKELANQRQLLAEERKALAQERSAGGPIFSTRLNSAVASPVGHVALASTSTTVTPIKQRLVIGHPGSPGQTNSPAGMVLWQHSAKKDQSFLEDEQFFLETLKNSPYNKKT
ncbi:fas-binding factor 1 homolog isoform X1 [Styela clava]